MVTTPVFVDAVGPTPGTNLNAADLNVFVQAITYRLSGGIASSASGLTVTQPACQAVINASGSAPIYLSVAATTVPLSAGPVVSQDQYVYLLNNGTYQVVSVNHGGTPTAPITANIPLYYATTNAGNTAVSSYTDISNANPIASQGTFMNTTGTNAGAVAFPSTLSVAAATSLLGSATVATTLGVTGLSTLTGGATMGADIAMGNQKVKNAGSIGVGTSSPVGPIHVAVAPAASNNFGVISVGSGPFDGVSGGKFIGTTGNGTLIAGNTAAGFGGNLLDLQNGGVSKALISGAGAMTLAGNLGAANLSASGTLAVTGISTLSAHLLSTGSAPALSNPLSSWTNSIVGTDTKGRITFVVPAPFSMNDADVVRACTVAFASAYGSIPAIQVTAENLNGVGVFLKNVSASGFDIDFSCQISGASGFGTVFVSYTVIG